MTNTTFNPPLEIRATIPPTADEQEEPCGSDTPSGKLRAGSVRRLPKADAQPGVSPRSTFRQRIIQGEVQDENASTPLGGVAPTRRAFFTAARPREIRPSNADRGPPHPPPRNHSPLHPSRTRATSHVSSSRLGHALHPIAIRKTFLAKLLRPSWLHRNLSLDRPDPPTLHHSINQPHLARLLQPSHKTSPAKIPQRSNRVSGKVRGRMSHDYERHKITKGPFVAVDSPSCTFVPFVVEGFAIEPLPSNQHLE